MHKGVSPEAQRIGRRDLSELSDVLITLNNVIYPGIDFLGVSLGLTSYVSGITCWVDCGSGQESLVLCCNPVVKGMATILYRSNPTVKLLLGSGEIFLGIVILNNFLECVYHEMDDVRGGAKVNLTRRATTMVVLSHEFIYTKTIQNTMARSTLSFTTNITFLSYSPHRLQKP